MFAASWRNYNCVLYSRVAADNDRVLFMLYSGLYTVLYYRVLWFWLCPRCMLSSSSLWSLHIKRATRATRTHNQHQQHSLSTGNVGGRGWFFPLPLTTLVVSHVASTYNINHIIKYRTRGIINTVQCCPKSGALSVCSTRIMRRPLFCCCARPTRDEETRSSHKKHDDT